MQQDASPVTPAIAGELATHLAEEILRLRGWGIRIAESGRLPVAQRLLARVAQQERFPSDIAALTKVSYAIRDAQEWIEIGAAILQQPHGPLFNDLRVAVGGELGGRNTGTLKAIQHQTQLWVGAMVAHTGIEVRVPSGSPNQSPDFEVSNGTLIYGLEVKRPTENLRASRLVSDAAKQLASTHYHGGGLVVDISDCIAVGGIVVTQGESPDPTFGLQQFADLAEEIENEVFNPELRRIEIGRQQIFTVVTLLRVFSWNSTDLSRAIAFRRVRPAVFWRRQRNTLRHHRARWLYTILTGGLEKAGYVLVTS